MNIAACESRWWWIQAILKPDEDVPQPLNPQIQENSRTASPPPHLMQHIKGLTTCQSPI